MRRLFALVCAVVCAGSVSAARHVVFETDLYNRAFPLAHEENAVFSPLSAEVDCATVAEALETIPKANVAESMGVLTELSGVYVPVLTRFANCTNGFTLTMARGFCLPTLREARSDYRQQVQRDYGAEVLPLFPSEGAETWFRAAMDGTHEDFEVPVPIKTATKYAFYDLVSARAEWQEPFPTSNVRRLKFQVSQSNRVERTFMSDVRMADSWSLREYDILRLPLREGLSFYVLFPHAGIAADVVREDFSSLEIENLLAMTGDPSIGHFCRGPTVVVIPRMEISCRVDLTEVFQHFRVPTSSLAKLLPGISPSEYVQSIRFTLSENGPKETPLAAKPAEKQVAVTREARKFILTRPFLYFIYDPKTKTIPIAGQFTGIDETKKEVKTP